MNSYEQLWTTMNCSKRSQQLFIRTAKKSAMKYVPKRFDATLDVTVDETIADATPAVTAITPDSAAVSGGDGLRLTSEHSLPTRLMCNDNRLLDFHWLGVQLFSRTVDRLSMKKELFRRKVQLMLNWELIRSQSWQSLIWYRKLESFALHSVIASLLSVKYNFRDKQFALQFNGLHIKSIFISKEKIRN